MVQTKMGRHWFQEKGWFIRKMWPFKTKSRCKTEVSKMRPTCKSHTDDKLARASAVKRKRAVAQGVGGKPTNVKTFAKRKQAMMGGFMGRRMGIR